MTIGHPFLFWTLKLFNFPHTLLVFVMLLQIYGVWLVIFIMSSLYLVGKTLDCLVVSRKQDLNDVVFVFQLFQAYAQAWRCQTKLCARYLHVYKWELHCWKFQVSKKLFRFIWNKKQDKNKAQSLFLALILAWMYNAY